MTPPELSENELVARLRAADEEAYEMLFRTHAGAMMAVARRFFDAGDDAADALQDAFISAFRTMETFGGTAKLGTWLHRITVNACFMQLRRRKRRPSVSLDEKSIVSNRREEFSPDRLETCRRV